MSALAAALLVALQPSPVEAMGCEALGVEIAALAQSALSGTTEQVRLSRAGEPTVGDEIASRIIGMVSGFLPGAAGAVVGTVAGAATSARMNRLAREGEAAQRRIDEIDSEQDGAMDRLLLLHEEHQRRCAPPRPAG